MGDGGRITGRALRPVGLAVALVGLGLAAWPPASLWMVLAGVTLATAVGLPLMVAGSPRLAAVLLPLAVVAVSVLGAWAPYARATGTGDARNRTHDGGVLVTREAAAMTLRAENPYVERFDEVLPASWAQVQGAGGELVGNPVVDHDPYLPGSFLVHVPFVLVATGFGVTWDPRILGWAALVAVVVVLARRPGPAFARLGAVAAVGNAFTITYLAWGTNDAFAVCCFVLALALASGRQPRLGWAGVALAVAISFKFLFLVAVPPLLVVVFAQAGWVGVRRWWTTPAVLAVTCLPYLVWSPGDFLDDVVWFNLGRTEPLMPTSGLGLPAVAPGVFHGVVLGAVTMLGLAIAFVVVPLVPLVARRARSLGWVGPLTSLGLLGLLVPARTFQINYLVLIVASAATGWWLVGEDAPDRTLDPAT